MIFYLKCLKEDFFKENHFIMITIKSLKEIEIMKKGGRLLAEIMEELEKQVKPGIKTMYLDRIVREKINEFAKQFPEAGIKPAFLGYKTGGNIYPSSICVSINDEVVHGLPSERVLREGDIVSLDLGLVFRSFNLDMAKTIAVGKVSEKEQNLISTAESALAEAIKVIRPGITLGDIGFTIQNYVESRGFSVIRDLVGHGIGKNLHEDPQVPNYGKKGKGMILKSGMTIAVEPMITNGSWQIYQDGWVWKTKDKSLSAHFEHTIAVVDNGCLVLTK